MKVCKECGSAEAEVSRLRLALRRARDAFEALPVDFWRDAQIRDIDAALNPSSRATAGGVRHG